MNFCTLAVFLPLLSAPVIGLAGSPAQGARANLLLNAVVLCLTIAVIAAPGSGLIHADGLSMIFGVLTSFVSLTTAISNIGFVHSGGEKLSTRRWRVYHAMCQVVL